MHLLNILSKKNSGKKITALTLLMASLLWINTSLATSWSGDGDVGFNKSSGNTDTESLLVRLGFSLSKKNWQHAIALGAVGASDDGKNTAESYTTKWKSTLNISEKYYSFGSVRYEKDRFSGYKFQLATAIGAGVNLFKNEITALNIEGGIGYRFSEESTGQDQNETTLSSSAAYRYQLTDTTKFSTELNAEAGSSNVYLNSISALKVSINSSLALKLTYAVKHNTDTPAGSKKTDTLSSVSLNYSF